MASWPRSAGRPGRGAARAALLVGLTSALVVGLTVVARDDARDVLSAADLERIEDAVEQGCPGSTEPLAEGTGFALDGTVVDVVDSSGRDLVAVTLRVREWYLGPPVEHVEVLLDRTTLGQLLADDPTAGLGTRLLVSGRGWPAPGDELVAAGCGRTRVQDDATAADWRRALGRPATARAQGPVATYPSAGFVRTGREPDLNGVAVLDSGCLYVQDGLTRWVPVMPSDDTAWQDRPPALELGGVMTDIGHTIRLGGLPAAGVGARGPGPTDDGTAPLLDPAGVPEACDPTAPRFVVAEPSVTRTPAVGAGRSSSVGVALEAARRAGLQPAAADGGFATDAFGATSSRVALQADDGGEVLVHVESVAFLAWPHAYAPQDADLAWSADPRQAPGLPDVPPGWQLAVVTRSDGVTQVLLRTPGRVVVSVTADPTTLTRLSRDPDDTSGVQVLTDVALDVAALSPVDVES